MRMHAEFISYRLHVQMQPYALEMAGRYGQTNWKPGLSQQDTLSRGSLFRYIKYTSATMARSGEKQSSEVSVQPRKRTVKFAGRDKSMVHEALTNAQCWIAAPFPDLAILASSRAALTRCITRVFCSGAPTLGLKVRKGTLRCDSTREAP